MGVGGLSGVGAALLGSVIGGSALALTRFATASVEPIAVAAVRYGVGALVLAPFAVGALRTVRGRRDWLGVTALSILFFAVYPYTFALALGYTTAVRGALVLSMLPLLTLAIATVVGRETFSWQTLAGVLVAMAGLAFALSSRIEGDAAQSWKGELTMLAAAAMQAVYNVYSKPFISRIGALGFTSLGMLIGAGVLAAAALAGGALAPLPEAKIQVWGALAYLGVAGGAILWTLWSLGLRFASATLVALTITVNTLTGSFLGAWLLGEPLGYEFAVGLVAVLSGIVLATKRT